MTIMGSTDRDCTLHEDLLEWVSLIAEASDLWSVNLGEQTQKKPDNRPLHLEPSSSQFPSTG